MKNAVTRGLATQPLRICDRLRALIYALLIVSVVSNFGFTYVYGTDVTRDDGDTLQKIRGDAAAGDGTAMFDLGSRYEQGRGVTQDYVAAIEWYRKGADKRDVHAMINLGEMFDEGRGVKQDYAEAVKWYRKAADMGDGHAMNNLGFMYKRGRGITQDYAEAIKWFRKAADTGDIQGTVSLGTMYELGEGVTRDYREALTCYRKGAKKGDGTALLLLGTMYEMGWGLTQDYVEAVKLYRKAADAGLSEAMIRVGLMLAEGRGAARDEGEAATWFRKAAALQANDVVSLQRSAQTYIEYNRYPEAVESYRQALKLDPANREVTCGLSITLTHLGRLDEALAVDREELATHPDDDATYNSMGQIFAAQRKPQQAIEMYESALKINPRSIAAKINYANTLFESGRAKEAATQLREAQGIDPTYFATYVVAATMQLQLRDFAGAEQNCRSALKLNPKSAEAWNNLGVAQCHESRVKDAIVSFQNALQIKPDYREAQNNLVLAQRNLSSSKQ